MIALVTGASRGIGRAIALALAEAGADLCVCATSNAALQPLVEAIGGRVRVVPVAADVSQRRDVEALVARCRQELGPIDWLVNNAGVVERGTIGELTEAQWDHVLDVNLKGPFLCTQAALPDLIARKGRVVNISSISGTFGSPKQAPYNASKWGLNGLTKCCAVELKPKGVFVAAVLPGSVDTDMLKGSGFPPQIEAEEIARIVRFLLTEAPFAMTGSLVEAFA